MISDDIATVKIGKQIWMATNFDGTTFRSGDSIPHIESEVEWERAGKEASPAWSYYKDDTAIAKTYGRIYNWYAVNDPRGFAPKGWRVQTNEEWIVLEEFLGKPHAGLPIRCDSSQTKDFASDSGGTFCLLLGGYRGKESGFSGGGEFTYLASSTERDQKLNDVWGRGIQYADSSFMRCGLYKEHGVYVGLIKD